MSVRVAIIGSGSWATALAKLLLNNCPSISWYVRKEEDVNYFREYKTNPRYLSSVEFDTNCISFFTDIRACVASAEYLVLAIPSAFLNQAFSTLSSKELENKIIFSAIKGIVPEHNLIVGEYLNSVYKVPIGNIGVITGPCHAEEVALEKL